MSGTEEPTMTTRRSVLPYLLSVVSLEQIHDTESSLAQFSADRIPGFRHGFEECQYPSRSLSGHNSCLGDESHILNAELWTLSTFGSSPEAATAEYCYTDFACTSFSVAVSKASVPRHSTGIAHDTVTHLSTRSPRRKWNIDIL